MDPRDCYIFGQEALAIVGCLVAAFVVQQLKDVGMQHRDSVLDAIRQVESGGGKYLVSPAGALGPYQLMPATAEALGVEDPFNEAEARSGASKLLDEELERFGSLELALAAYNAGSPRIHRAIKLAGSYKWPEVQRALIKMGLRETAEYVPSVFKEIEKLTA